MILGSNSRREREASWVRLQLSAVQGLVNVAMLDLFDRILRGGIDLHLGVLRILAHRLIAPSQSVQAYCHGLLLRSSFRIGRRPSLSRLRGVTNGEIGGGNRENVEMKVLLRARLSRIIYLYLQLSG